MSDFLIFAVIVLALALTAFAFVFDAPLFAMLAIPAWLVLGFELSEISPLLLVLCLGLSIAEILIFFSIRSKY